MSMIPADIRLTCPKDQGMMEKVKVGSVIVDRCLRCQAIWMDANEIERVLAVQGAAQKLDVPHPKGKADEPTVFALEHLTCPRDKSPLIEMIDGKQSHIRFHSCTVCGGALYDCGELKDLSEFSLKERIGAFLKR